MSSEERKTLLIQVISKIPVVDVAEALKVNIFVFLLTFGNGETKSDEKTNNHFFFLFSNLS